MRLDKPVIGISVSAKYEGDNERSHGLCTLCWNYMEGVADAGGIPLAILPMTDPEYVVDTIDGWLIPGGDDIDPTHYGREKHLKTETVDPRRYEGEVRLYQRFPREMPVLGICYGCQFINIQHGGTLHQHIPDVVGHEEHAGGTLADYEVVSGTKLYSIVGESKIRGKSYHHQAIDEVGQGLVVSARHADGVVESIEDPEYPWMLGIQWHPERTLKDRETMQIFHAFIEAASAYRVSKA